MMPCRHLLPSRNSPLQLRERKGIKQSNEESTDPIKQFRKPLAVAAHDARNTAAVVIHPRSTRTQSVNDYPRLESQSPACRLITSHTGGARPDTASKLGNTVFGPFSLRCLSVRLN